jgi:cation:H+ antiporter
MLYDLVIFLVGLVVLYYGAEWLIDAAAQMALDYGIRPIVVGLTVVALGTSMPEFVINVFAAVEGRHDLALGNIIGSNISNIALILGSCALVFPLVVTPQMLRKEYPMMLGAMVLFYVVALDGLISQLDGGLLVTSLVGVLAFLFYDARREKEGLVEDLDEAPAVPPVPEADPEPRWKKTLRLVGGVAFLAGGARMMVYGAVNIAETLGVQEMVIALTIVAIGTSLPELAASMVGALKDEADLSVGNVMGSNLLNVLFVVGFVALVSPLEVNEAESQALSLHFPIMMAFCLVLLPIAWTQHRISRLEGGALVAGFLGYVVYLILPYVG